MPKKKTNEEFLSEVRALVGDEYTFLEEYKGTNKHTSVKHNECGNVYSVVPAKFLQGRRCPACASNALMSTEEYKEKLKSLVGDEYVITSEYMGSGRKSSFIHKKCGRIIYMTPCQINSGKQCRYCFRERVAEQYRKGISSFKSEVCELTDGEYVVTGAVYVNAHTPITMIHNAEGCGYEWGITPHNFLQGNRCPKCKASKGEVAIFNFLKKTGVEFVSQHRFSDCLDRSQLPFDFAVIKDGSVELVIEYDGHQHFKPVKMWGGKKGFYEQVRRDKIKNDYCESNNIKILRIPYWEFENIDVIVFDKLVETGFLEGVEV